LVRRFLLWRQSFCLILSPHRLTDNGSQIMPSNNATLAVNTLKLIHGYISYKIICILNLITRLCVLFSRSLSWTLWADFPPRAACRKINYLCWHQTNKLICKLVQDFVHCKKHESIIFHSATMMCRFSLKMTVCWQL